MSVTLPGPTIETLMNGKTTTTAQEIPNEARNSADLFKIDSGFDSRFEKVNLDMRPALTELRFVLEAFRDVSMRRMELDVTTERTHQFLDGAEAKITELEKLVRSGQLGLIILRHLETKLSH